jgi:hypothetical protein
MTLNKLAVRVVRWVCIPTEAFGLFVFVSTSLFVPFPWDWEKRLYAAGAALVSLLCALYRSLQFETSTECAQAVKFNLFNFSFMLWLTVVVPVLAILALS